MNAIDHILALPILMLSALGVGACDKLQSTTTVRNFEVGARDERSWSRTWKDRAEFKCIATSSGGCEFVVFVEDCRTTTA